MKYIYALLYLVGQILVASAQCTQTDVIILDSTAIRALFTTPRLLVLQPVAGHYIQVERIDVRFSQNTQPYPAQPVLTFYYDGFAEGSFYSLQLLANGMTKATETLNEQIVAPDAAVYVTIPDSNRTSGNGILTLYVTYRVASLTGTTRCDSMPAPPTDGTICQTTVHLTSAQILNLWSNAQVIVPAPPPNKFINVISAQVKMYGETPYTGFKNLVLFYTDSNRVLAVNTNALAADHDTVIWEFAEGGNDGKISLNAPVKIGIQVGNTASGTGSADISVLYNIMDIDTPICFGGSNTPVGNSGIIDITTTASAVTGVTTEQIVYSVQVAANTFASGDISEFDVALSKTGINADMTARVYVNASNSLTGADLVATWTSSNISTTTDLERRRLLWGGGGFQVFDPAESNYTDLNSSNTARGMVMYATNTAKYWVVTIQLDDSSDEGVMEGFILRNNHK